MFNDLFKLELKCLSRIFCTFYSLNMFLGRGQISNVHLPLVFYVLSIVSLSLLVQKTNQFRLVIQQLSRLLNTLDEEPTYSLFHHHYQHHLSFALFTQYKKFIYSSYSWKARRPRKPPGLWESHLTYINK